MDVSELQEHADDFWNTCVAEGLAVSSADSYKYAVKLLSEWAVENQIETLTRRDIQRFFGYLQTANARPAYNHKSTRKRRLSAAYIVHLRTGLRKFVAWAQEEQLIDEDLMKGIRRPKIQENPVPIIPDADLAKIVAACRTGKDGPQRARFASIRDTAMIRLLIDCGLRREELSTMRVDDVDFEVRVVTVTGKGRKVRQVPFGIKTYASLKAYLKARGKHPHSASDRLFVSTHGGMSNSGVTYVIQNRCKLAGLSGVHPHQFRHTLAHRWLREGLDGTSLMRIMGWSSASMLQVYGRSGTTERALTVHRNAALGDQV